ncbi:MAG: substrate-binding periplasmic protein, partial [Paracoccaceae bacterium]
AEMEKSVAYGNPFMATEIRFVGRKGGPISYETLGGLEGHRIAVGTGFLYEEGFDNADTLDKYEVTTTLQGIRMVAAGRADLTLDSEHVVGHAINVEDPELSDLVEMIPGVLARREVHMAVVRTRPDHARIVSDFNAALQEMRNDGSLAAIMRSHNAN